MVTGTRLALCLPLLAAACGGTLDSSLDDLATGTLDSSPLPGDLAPEPPPAVAFAPPAYYPALHADDGPIDVGRIGNLAHQSIVVASSRGGELTIYGSDYSRLDSTRTLATGVTRAVSVRFRQSERGDLDTWYDFVVADGDKPQLVLLTAAGERTTWPLGKPAVGAMAVGDFGENGYSDVAVTTDQVEILHTSKGFVTNTLATGLAVVEQLGAVRLNDYPNAGLVTFASFGIRLWRERRTNARVDMDLVFSFEGNGRNPALGYAVGSFNGDFATDLMLAPDGMLTVLLGDGTGSFVRGAGGAKVGGGEFQLGDFNADGKIDVAARSGSGAGVEVHLGDGTGRFLPPQVFSFDSAPGSTIVHLASGRVGGQGELALVATLDGATRRIAVLAARY